MRGSGLGDVGEGKLESACRKVAIDGGFSVHEQVKMISSFVAHIEFPHPDAAAEFAEKTHGQLIIGARSFTVSHTQAPTYRQIKDETAEPTDTLIVKQLGVVTESELAETFGRIAPRIKSVQIPKNFAGLAKGFGHVSFHAVHEAEAALRHYRDQQSLIGGRRCPADFAPKETFEETLVHEEQKRQADTEIEESHAQALNGVNGDMWANYLAMFNGGAASQEPEAKRQRNM